MKNNLFINVALRLSEIRGFIKATNLISTSSQTLFHAKEALQRMIDWPINYPDQDKRDQDACMNRHAKLRPSDDVLNDG